MRRALAEGVAGIDPALQRHLLMPLLEDPVRSVRIAAATALAEDSGPGWSPAERSLLQETLRESERADQVSAERPEARMNAARRATLQGDDEEATRIYEGIIARFPYFVPAYLNLADQARGRGDTTRSIALLRRGLEVAPEAGALHYALGLALHRAGDPDAALTALEEAARRTPEDARFVLARALALDGRGDRGRALQVLGDALSRGIESADLHHARVAFLGASGERSAAREALAVWAASFPADARIETLRGQLAR